MEPTTLSLSTRLHHSLRLGGWSKIMIPTALGQIIGFYSGKEPSSSSFALGFLLSTLCLLSIIFLNDLADEEVDSIKRSLFPQDSSPKTLPDKLLPKSLVLALAIGSSLGLVALGFLIQILEEKAFFGLFSCLIIFLNYSYSFYPLKLNYRFGGEFAEAFGVGFFLPYYNAYLQSSLLWSPYYFVFFGFFFWALASALCSGFCDVVSDKLGGKKTFCVLYGNKRTGFFIFLSLAFCVFSWLPISMISGHNFYASILFCAVNLFPSQKEFFSYFKKEDLETSLKTQKKFRNFVHRIILLFSFAFFLNLLFLS